MLKRLSILWVLALPLGACAGPRQILIHQKYVDDRVVRYTLEPSIDGDENQGAVYNLHSRLCDVQDASVETACQDSLILENVKPGSVY